MFDRENQGLILLAFAAAVWGTVEGQATAGWFGRKDCECCQQVEKEKKSKCFHPAEPPRAGIVDAVPARITNVRAAPVPGQITPPSSAVAPVPLAPAAAGTTEERLDRLENDIKDIRLQLQVITTFVQSKE